MRFFSNIFLISFALFCITLGSVHVVLALEDQFSVRLNVIDFDTDPPSTPINLIATGVSISQIDLMWDDATDNAGVIGYTITRDGLPLATTTIAMYNDIGLMSATTYDYTIRAFDASNNYSSSSATSSATTLTPAPPASTSTSSKLSGSRQFLGLFGGALKLDHLKISPIDDRSLLVDFSMNQPVVAKIFWGKTADFELGSASHLLLNSHQSFTINELEPEARYFIQIEVTTILGRKVILGPYFAQTRLSKPVNPYDFSGLGVSDGIILSWRYPTYGGNYDVRLLRSEYGHPNSPFDGNLVYEGRATAVKDRDVARGKRYYYTLFSILDGDRYSSGVVTSALYRQMQNIFVVDQPQQESSIVGEVAFIQQKPIIPHDGVWQALPNQPVSIRFSTSNDAYESLEKVIISFTDESGVLHNAYLLYFDSILNTFTSEIDAGLGGRQDFVLSGYDHRGSLVYQSSGVLAVQPETAPSLEWSWWAICIFLIKFLVSLIFALLGWLTLIIDLWY